MEKQTLAFIGAGTIAASLIGGLIKNQYPAEKIWASNPDQTCLDDLHSRFGIHIDQDNNAVAEHADIIILAVKPTIIATVVKQLAAIIERRQPLLISVAASISIPFIEKQLHSAAAIIRCMPNTPALVGHGATALYANTHTSEAQRNTAESIMRAVGITQWLEKESLLDAVTALSGSGPAYFFLLMEAMEAAAIEMGLTKDTAHLLTVQTALGAASMALQSTKSCADLRAQVTSPGGTTEAALRVLEPSKIRNIVKDAMCAAALRAKPLA